MGHITVVSTPPCSPEPERQEITSDHDDSCMLLHATLISVKLDSLLIMR